MDTRNKHVINYLCVLFSLTGLIKGTRGSCTIKCGVVDTSQEESGHLLNFVQNIWYEIQNTRKLNDVTLTFHTLERRMEMDWDTFVEAYMEIGNKNVSAIFGPYVQPIVTSSERYEIPYFLLDTLSHHQYSPFNLLQVFPEPSAIYTIAVDVVKRYQIDDIAILYEETYGGELIQELVQWPSIRIRAYKLSYLVSKQDIRQALISIRHLAVTNIIVVASRSLTNDVLEQALSVSILSSRFRWIIPSLNQEESDLNKYLYTEVNLTMFELNHNQRTTQLRPQGSFTKFEHATIYDALLTFYESVKLHSRGTRDCLWTGSENILRILSKVDVEGATGRLTYSRNGTRRGYVIDVMGIQSERLTKIGHWNSSKEPNNRLFFDSIDAPEEAHMEFPFGKDVVKVVTMLEDPFVMLVADHQNREGNDRFEGFCVDLIRELATELDFEYEIYLPPDRQFGSKNSDGKWNGMVRELMNGNASLSVASLTITAERESVMDFSTPFRPRGLTMMMKLSQEKDSYFEFQLLDPLSPVVWTLIVVVLVTISFILYVLDKISLIGKTQEEPFSLHQCIWFTFSSLLRSSVGYAPHSVPGKIVAGFLWFFSLIIISTYTANLAAFLTISKFVTPVQSVFDLANQAKVHYGTVTNSATSDFFEDNKLDYFRNMWEYMSSVDTSGMVTSHEQGIQKVKQSDGDYAFIWDADVIRHTVNTDCHLVEIGQPFDNAKGYGIGTPLGASYRDQISMAILRLNEEGILLQLDEKWWGPPNCPIISRTSGTRQALSLKSISGLFVVLCGGVAIAFIVAVITYFIRRRKLSKNKFHEDGFLKEERNNVHIAKNRASYAVNLKTPSPVEEPFLNTRPATPNHTASSSKQTNIF